MSDRAIPIDGRSYQIDGRAVARRAIPNSLVTRPADKDQTTSSSKFGVRIEADDEWEDIEARISDKPEDYSRAYIYRASDGGELAQVDISTFDPGDVVLFEDVNLQPEEEYNIVVDADGSSMEHGRFDDIEDDLPYESDDGQLRIIDGAEGEQDTRSDFIATIEEVGNITGI